MEPAIKSWRNSPPTGGWAIEYEEDGQTFPFGGSPNKIVQAIEKVQRANGTFASTKAIWNYCNGIWCGRSPERCIHSMVDLRAAATGAAPAQSSSGSCVSCGGGAVV